MLLSMIVTSISKSIAINDHPISGLLGLPVRDRFAVPGTKVHRQGGKGPLWEQRFPSHVGSARAGSSGPVKITL